MLFENLKVGAEFSHRGQTFVKLSTAFAISAKTGKRVRFIVTRAKYPTRSRCSTVKVH